MIYIKHTHTHTHTYLQSRNKDIDVEMGCMDSRGEKWWWDELGDWDLNIYTTMYKMYN